MDTYNDTLVELAQRIAATGKWVPRIGQAVQCRGQHGCVISLMGVGNQWTDVEVDGITRPADLAGCRLLLQDDLTVLSLLADLPRHDLVQGRGKLWLCAMDRFYHTDNDWHPTRAEAVAKAWLAVHETACTHGKGGAPHG